MQVTKTKKVHDTHIYHLSDDVHYVIEYENNVETSRYLKYIGETLNGYNLHPFYKEDISILQKWNPCWGESNDPNDKGQYGDEWLQDKSLPAPETIDLDKIRYVQMSSHSFFDINKEPIPVVVKGNYIEAKLNDFYFDLQKVKLHFDNHPNIAMCSNIERIPSYNSGDTSGYNYLSVLVIPTKEILQYAYAKKINIRDAVFTKVWDPNSPDFLNIKQFAVRDTYD